MKIRRLLTLALALLANLAFAAPSSGAPRPADAPTPSVRVQLSWTHQTQFAGFYMAQARRHFATQGIKVHLEPGESNPVGELIAGRADVVVAQLSNVLANSTPRHPLVNIAQIFQGQPLILLCRVSAGVASPEQMVGKRIAVANWGDGDVARAIVQQIAPGDTTTEYVERRAGSYPLADRLADCMTAMTYNEYWRALDRGVPAEDLLVIRPVDYGLPELSDGLYVLRERLESPEFVEALVRLVRALDLGWRDARAMPSLAIEQTLLRNPSLEVRAQRTMLDAVLTIVPERDFGKLDIGRFESVRTATLRNFPQLVRDPEGSPRLWTHAIWNRVDHDRARHLHFTDATVHYVREMTRKPAFTWLFTLGLMVFAMSSTLIAVSHGLDLWGRLCVAYLSCLGGGVLRDYLVGGERLPLGFLTDLTIPFGIFVVVCLITAVTSLYAKDIRTHRSFHRVQRVGDAFGFGVVSMYGATIPIVADLPLVWAPLCGALTIAGGGILRDIMLNHEPSNFRGAIFEEIVIAGSVVMLAVLFVADRFEHNAWLVQAALIIAILVCITGRIVSVQYRWRYPWWLGGPRRKTDAS